MPDFGRIWAVRGERVNMLSRRSVALSIVGSLLAATPAIASAHGHAAAWKARPATYGITKTTNVPIKMDDGVVLKADVLRPAAADGSAAKGTFPVILTQTPYNKNSPSLNFENDYLVERGYIQVIVDVRGTGSSGGEWASFSPREQKDYYECTDRLTGSTKTKVSSERAVPITVQSRDCLMEILKMKLSAQV